MRFYKYDLGVGIELIKKYEGCELTAYKCPAGIWTIGYGTTKNVVEGQEIDEKEAKRLLMEDILEVANTLYKLTSSYNLSNNQFNAFLSFFYNLGFKNDQSNRFRKGESIDIIVSKIPLYVNAGGKPLNGLIKRRKEEYNLAR